MGSEMCIRDSPDTGTEGLTSVVSPEFPFDEFSGELFSVVVSGTSVLAVSSVVVIGASLPDVSSGAVTGASTLEVSSVSVTDASLSGFPLSVDSLSGTAATSLSSVASVFGLTVVESVFWLSIKITQS